MKLNYIDVLRGIAILGVLMVHCGQYGHNDFIPVTIANIIGNGANGVQLFYIASAFTLFLSMNRRNENEKYPKLNFFIRRFFRIAPLYYIGIFYYLWQDGFGSRYWLGDQDLVTTANILSNIFFVHGFNPYWINSVVPGGWSIAVEMLFYCIAPFLFVKIKNVRVAYLFVLVTLVLRLVLDILLHKIHLIESDRLWNEYLFFYFPSQLPIFALGIFFYYIVQEGYDIKIAPPALLLTSFLLILHIIGFSLLPIYFIFGIVFVLFGIAISKINYKILENPVLLYIGKVSYSMYLVHFGVLYWLTKFDLVDFIVVNNSISAIINYCLRFVVLVSISILFSTISYQLIELPGQRIGQRIIHKLRKNESSIS